MELLFTLLIVGLAMAALVATAAAVRRVMLKDDDLKLRLVQTWLLTLITAGAGILFVVRSIMHGAPVDAHVDGLLLISSLCAGSVLFLTHPSRIPGLGVFALPLLSLLLLWSICASAWTLYLFEIDSVWKMLHLLGVYLGSLGFAIAAAGAGQYLYVQSRLRRKADPTSGPRFASLEATERLIIRMSAVGFALLTVGSVAGVVVAASRETRLGELWWASPKVMLSAVVWVIFAIVANVRHSTTFRGARAAWLSIAGFAIVLAIFAASTLVPNGLRPGGPG